MRGFTRDGTFHPITDYKKGTRKSRDQSTKSTGVKVERKARDSLHCPFCKTDLTHHYSPVSNKCPSCRKNLANVELIHGERKARDIERSYWSQKGKYQNEADVLNKLVPNEGESPDRNVDLYRRASNLYYEIFNNGGDNLEGEGNDFEVRRFENEGFDLPITNLLIEELNKIDDNNELIGDRDKYFEGAQNEMDTLMDQVIEQIMESRKHA
ncbi:MAG: hypothetical protein KJI69_03805 [Patescibacteria group bacterium]|nr:hypothetical protein [Patescibacteria group bacterium]